MKTTITRFFPLFFLSAIVLNSCQQPAESTSSFNAEQLISNSENMWNNQNLKHLDKDFHADFKRISPFGTVSGLDAWKSELEGTWKTWSDTKLKVNGYWVDGDIMTMVWTWKGTNTGPLGEEVPATGKTITVEGMSKMTFKDGKVIEDRLYWDRLAANEQMGFTMMPPQLASDNVMDE